MGLCLGLLRPVDAFSQPQTCWEAYRHTGNLYPCRVRPDVIGYCKTGRRREQILSLQKRHAAGQADRDSHEPGHALFNGYRRYRRWGNDTFPEIPDGRYASVYVVDIDHYVPAVFYEPGVHKLPQDIKYVGIGVRIQLFNPNDPEEIKLINKLQDQFVIHANSADPFPPFEWDDASLNSLRSQYLKEAEKYPSYKGMQGPRGKVDEKTRHIAAAAAWGLFPEWDATYLNYSADHDIGSCWRATYQVPENKAFWSITVYGRDGFLKSGNAIVNSSNVKLNDDGTFTVYYGSRPLCGKVANRLDVTPGWNFLMRIYRPGQSVLNGSYRLPQAKRYLRDMIENYIREYPNQQQTKR